MKLHDIPLSGNAYKVRLFLSLIGQSAELVNVDLRSGVHKRPAFLAINPRGQVPALEDGDFGLGDSQAILVYLARRYAEPSWYPLDAEPQGRIAHWLSFAANEIQHGPAQARVIQLFKRPGDLGAAAGGADQRGQHVDHRRLARPVGAEEAEEIAVAHGDVDRVDRAQLAVVLAEPERLDDRRGAHDRIRSR